MSVLTSVLEEFCLSLKQCDPQCTVALEVLASPCCAEHTDAFEVSKAAQDILAIYKPISFDGRFKTRLWESEISSGRLHSLLY